MIKQKTRLIFGLIIHVIIISHCNLCTTTFDSLKDDSFKKQSRYLLYDVNVGEGFNLKRDVYMRIAMFVRTLAEKHNNWYLVLPPWSKQWHWNSESTNISYQWHVFFDVPSLQLFSPVIEIDTFYSDYGKAVDEVYILQHFPEFYEASGGVSMDWSDKWNFSKCRDHPYWKKNDGKLLFFHGKNIVEAKKVSCISFQGTSAYLESVILSSTARSIMFDRAEVATHIFYGDSNYWMCRRSMRFAKHLVSAARVYRATYLSSLDKKDGTVRPLDWREERPHRSANGGPYLGVHLRRQDFIYGRPKEIPSLSESVLQIKNYLSQLNLTTVFVASDMTSEEYMYLRHSLEKNGLKTLRYDPVIDGRNQFKDGELAIIDQIIASHARFFVGTHESTFTYRIQEEREIMGFPIGTTFNIFCPQLNGLNCTSPSKWKIKYPDINSGKSELKFDRYNIDEL